MSKRYKMGLNSKVISSMGEMAKQRKMSESRDSKRAQLSPDPFKKPSAGLRQNQDELVDFANEDQRTLNQLGNVSAIQRVKNSKVSEEVQDTVKQQQIEQQHRSIEHVELDYFMKQSRKRLVQVKSGVQLLKAVDVQRQKSIEPLKRLQMAIDHSRARKTGNEYDRHDELSTPRVLSRTQTQRGPLVRQNSRDLLPLNQTMPTRNVGRSLDRSTPALTNNGKLVIQTTKPGWSIDQYYNQTKFNPEAEVEKEHRIDEFFYQKFQRVEEFLMQAEIDAEKASAKVRSSNINFGLNTVQPTPRLPQKRASVAPIKRQNTLKPSFKEKDLYLKGIKDLEATMESKKLNHLLLEKAKAINQEDMTQIEKSIANTKNVRERYKMEDGLMYALRLITYVQENERDKMVQELEVREEEKRDKKLKKTLLDEKQKLIFKKEQRKAFMPMHRPLPDFVQQNTLKKNFYEDESNKPQINESIKFLNKIDPELVQSVPMAKEILQEALKKDAQARIRKSKQHKIDVFALDKDNVRESQGEETDHDIFVSEDMGENIIHTQNGRKHVLPKGVKIERLYSRSVTK